MRGGLGRTLLTAFLVLAIVPLSTLSWYATRRERQDIQREVMAKLSSVATMMEAQVRQWTQSRVQSLRVLASVLAVRENGAALASGLGHAEANLEESIALRAQLSAMLEQDAAFYRLAFLDREGQVLVSTDSPEASSDACAALSGQMAALLDRDAVFQFTSFDSAVGRGAIATHQVTSLANQPVGMLVGWLDVGDLSSQLQAASKSGEGGEVYLVDASGMALPRGEPVSSVGIEAALSGHEQEGCFQNYADLPVIGVYRWMPDLGLALVAEQLQEKAFAPTDNVTAAIVGATLLVALATAIIAAIVTRQVTQPVVRLTESALSIAEGDLEQRVPVTSRDEIGILAFVFNRMASELKELYDDLEAKVAQRTAMLQRANYQIQRRAIQLAATVEVSQAATSILEPARLLQQVVQLVHHRFGYSYVGVYLLGDGPIDGSADGGDGGGGIASLPSESEGCLLLCEGTGGGEAVESVKAQPVPLPAVPFDRFGAGPLAVEGGPGGPSVPRAVGRAVREAMLTGEPCVVEWDAEHAEQVFSSSYIRVEAALPLKMGDQIIGVLDILDTESDEQTVPQAREPIDDDAVSVLRNVANQITIALENARIYKKEKETARRLLETEDFRSRFLAHMSHELREPLTNIIGFSRLILKGLDGPITDQQRRDIQIIHANSQHLLGLINDLLDVSQIEAGLVELHFQELDLSELINSVMATTSALVRDKDIQLRHAVDDLPLVQADATRIRQVLLKLLTNAAEFTDQGTIRVRAWSDNHGSSPKVLVSVSDTGNGISAEDQKRVFERFEQGTFGNGRRPNGAGLGLALSKEFVEMHGGEIWVESELGKGSTFTFSLPLSSVHVSSELSSERTTTPGFTQPAEGGSRCAQA
jgi:signal transduction histidine kinase